MYEQMTIFDLIGPPEKKDLELMTEEDVVKIVSDATGIPFVYRDDLFGWEHTEKKVTFDIKLGRFTVDDHARFVHAGWTDRRDGYSGCGCPCRSIDEAIEFFRSKRCQL
jgi:hypothetical protein